VLGDIAETIPQFLQTGAESPIGYVSLDVDYYWSSVEALAILTGPPEHYLPIVNLYLDDSQGDYHNPSCGEMLACAEFNEQQALRAIHPYTALREKRLFKNANWISKIYSVHIFDHALRTRGENREASREIRNPYLAASNG
jgi:hypothetical protein